MTNNNSGQSVAWTIRAVAHPCWTIRLVDNPQVDIATIHHSLYYGTYMRHGLYYGTVSTLQVELEAGEEGLNL